MVNNKKYLYSIADICVWIYWGFQMIMKGFALESTAPIFHYGIFLILPIAMVKMFTDYYSKKDVISSILVVGIGLACFYKTHDDSMLIIAFTLILFRTYEIEKICKWSCVIRGTAFLMHIILALVGIMDIGKINVQNERLRYTFGYSHANLTQAEFFIIVVYYIFAKKGKLKIHEYIVITALNFGLYMFTDSRTGFALIMLMLIINALQKIKFINKLMITQVGCFVFFAVVGIFFSRKFYTYGWMSSFGNFSSRFQTAYYLQRMAPISLLGRYGSYVSDLGYVNLLCNGGLLAFLTYICTHTVIYIKMYREKRWYIVTYLFVLSVYYIMEGFSDSILYDISWLYLGEILFVHKMEDKERLVVCNANQGELTGV